MKQTIKSFPMFCSKHNMEVEMRAFFYDAEELDCKKWLINRDMPIYCNKINESCCDCSSLSKFIEEFKEYPMRDDE